MAKRKTMDDVFARMGELNATRAAPEPDPEPDPVPVVDPDTVEAPATARAAKAEPATVVSASPAVELDKGGLRDGTPTAYKPDHGRTRARSHVEKQRIAVETRPATVPKGYNVRPPRIEKPHQSIYADPAVFRVIRQIAATEDVKPQDLYREALRLMLKKRGYDFDKLDNGET